MFCVFVENVIAEQKGLDIYQQILDEMNNELNTNYRFPSEEEMLKKGETYQDLVDFYSAMSVDEFKQYVYSAHQNVLDGTIITNWDYVDYTNSLLSYTKTQKYYYEGSSTGNYLYLKTKAYSGGGMEHYIEALESGHTERSYPCYYNISTNVTFSKNMRKLVCEFNCSRFVSKNLSDNSYRTFKIPFEADGGDVYTVITVDNECKR